MCGPINCKTYEVVAWSAGKGLVWYDPVKFTAKGYQVPTTWADLLTWQAKRKADGTPPR